MELREYIKIFRAQKKMIIGFAVLGFLCALAFSFIAYQGYKGSLSLVVRPAFSEQSQDFHYSGFYALEASDKVTRMAQEWLKRKEPDASVLLLGSQYLEITFVKENEKELARYRDAVLKNAATFVQSLSKYPQNAFEVYAASFIVKKQTPYFSLNLVIGAATGLLLGIFAALFNHYRKEGE